MTVASLTPPRNRRWLSPRDAGGDEQRKEMLRMALLLDAPELGVSRSADYTGGHNTPERVPDYPMRVA